MHTQTGGSVPSDRLHNEAFQQRQHKGQKRDKGSQRRANVSSIYSRSRVKMKAGTTTTQIIPADFWDNQASGFILNRS